MKVILRLLILFFLYHGNSFGQKNYGLGLSIGGAKGNYPVDQNANPTVDYNRAISFIGVTNFLKKDLIQLGFGSIGLCTPVTLGFTFGEETVRDHLYYDAHSIIQLQFGALSSEENYSKNGGYLGAGFGIARGVWSAANPGSSALPNRLLNSWGPIFEAGLRERYGRADYYSEVRFFFRPVSIPKPEKSHNIFGGSLIVYLK